MSDNKWTPGPWATLDHGVGELVVYEEGTQDAICILDDNDESYAWKDGYSVSPEAKANANLLAAAPEIWEQLYETHSALMFKDPEYLGSEQYKRNAMALAKARGGL